MPLTAGSETVSKIIDFQVEPANYRHWRVEYDGEIANLFMDVDEAGGFSKATSSS